MALENIVPIHEIGFKTFIIVGTGTMRLTRKRKHCGITCVDAQVLTVGVAGTVEYGSSVDFKETAKVPSVNLLKHDIIR